MPPGAGGRGAEMKRSISKESILSDEESQGCSLSHIQNLSLSHEVKRLRTRIKIRPSPLRDLPPTLLDDDSAAGAGSHGRESAWESDLESSAVSVLLGVSEIQSEIQNSIQNSILGDSGVGAGGGRGKGKKGKGMGRGILEDESPSHISPLHTSCRVLEVWCYDDVTLCVMM